MDADDFDQEALRREIHSLCEKRKSKPKYLIKILVCHNATRIFYLFEDF